MQDAVTNFVMIQIISQWLVFAKFSGWKFITISVIDNFDKNENKKWILILINFVL